MRKVVKKKGIMDKNAGSSTVEMCFVMPIVIGIIYMVINLYLDAIYLGREQGSVYTEIYQMSAEGIMFEDFNYNQIQTLTLNVDGGTIHVSGEKEYSREYDLCTSRLRRWQLYGDVFSDQGD